MLRPFASILLLVMSFASAHAEVTWLFNLEKGIARARAQNKPLFVDVMAPWCGFCRKMREQVYPTRAFEDMSKSFVTVRINAEEDVSVSKFSIQGFPTLLMLDKNGSLISRIDGFVDIDHLIIAMKDALGRSGKEDKLVRDTKEKPGMKSSFEAGLYYAQTGDQAKARSHFLAAWESGKAAKDPASYDCLFNAAVSSMELRDYNAAVKLWSEYVRVYPTRDSDFAHARYFRGLALRSMGKLDQAKDDMLYAAANLPDGEDRQSAQRMARVK